MSDTATMLRNAVRQAERRAGDGAELGGTGQTILRKRLPPVAYLVERGGIGGEEVRAADEISLAFISLSGGLLMRSGVWERVDYGRAIKTHQRACQAEFQYKEWARVWSVRWVRDADPMLRVIIAAVVDERPVRTIAEDIGRHHSVVRKGIVAGLRDYAARAEWVAPATAQHWMDEAAKVFNRGKR